MLRHRRPVGAGSGGPIPQSVVLVLLYVGLLRLVGLQLAVAIPSSHYPAATLQAFMAGADSAGLSLPGVISGINLLFVVYLWLGFRATIRSGPGGRLVSLVAYLGSGFLLLYLTHAFWRLSQAHIPWTLERVL